MPRCSNWLPEAGRTRPKCTLLTGAGEIQWSSKLGGRGGHPVVTDDDGSQGMDDGSDKQGTNSEIAGSLYLVCWKPENGYNFVERREWWQERRILRTEHRGRQSSFVAPFVNIPKLNHRTGGLVEGRQPTQA